MHDVQFTEGDSRHAERCDGKEQIFPRALLYADEQMRQSHGHTCSQNQRPNECDPAHERAIKSDNSNNASGSGMISRKPDYETDAARSRYKTASAR